MASPAVINAQEVADDGHSFSGTCFIPDIPANVEELEAQGNAAPQDQPPAKVNGILDLTNVGTKKAKIILTTNANQGAVVKTHHYTIHAGSSLPVAWMMKANQLFQVSIESTQPLQCENSDWTVQ